MWGYDNKMIKIKNPFRTRIFVYSASKFNLVITIPFFGKPSMRKNIVKMKGRVINSIFIDEAKNIKKEMWENLTKYKVDLTKFKGTHTKK